MNLAHLSFPHAIVLHCQIHGSWLILASVQKGLEKLTMRLCFAHIVIGTLAASNVVQSQTPPGTNPATSRNLGVKYGSAEFTSNVLLLEESKSTCCRARSNLAD